MIHSSSEPLILSTLLYLLIHSAPNSYLTYLRYFKSPRYARFLQYPQALHHLDLLTSPTSGKAFRTALKDQPLLAQDLAGKQLSHWAGWREGGEKSVWREGGEAEEREEEVKVAVDGEAKA